MGRVKVLRRLDPAEPREREGLAFALFATLQDQSGARSPLSGPVKTFVTRGKVAVRVWNAQTHDHVEVPDFSALEESVKFRGQAQITSSVQRLAE